MRFAVLSAIIFAMDQFTKRMAERKLELNSKVEVIKGKLYFLHMRNEGAAYGILAKNRKLLTVLTALSCADIFMRFRQIYKDGEADNFYRFSLACMIGGGLGNVVDRVRKKYVTDFIFIPYSKRAPVFNIADIAVAIGGIVFVANYFIKSKKS